MVKSISKEKVYELTKQIPRGMVSTYSAIAKAAGNPRAARVVGRFMNMNPNPIIIPCHRVVQADGRVGGFKRGVSEKIRLLESEGIKVIDGKIQNFDKHLFTEFQI
ncbi:MAG: MGMT family protein [Nitrososphaerales archaeon]|nr:MGMT family protein [Nitrososphaerales archaeon]